MIQLTKELFLSAEAIDGIGIVEKAALSNLSRFSRDGFEKLMTNNELDALVTPDYTVSNVLAIGGFPGISVPAGYDMKGTPLVFALGG